MHTQNSDLCLQNQGKNTVSSRSLKQTNKQKNRRGQLNLVPTLRILGQELANYNLQTKSGPLSEVLKLGFIGTQSHSFMYKQFMSAFPLQNQSRCKIKDSNCLTPYRKSLGSLWSWVWILSMRENNRGFLCWGEIKILQLFFYPFIISSGLFTFSLALPLPNIMYFIICFKIFLSSV